MHKPIPEFGRHMDIVSFVRSSIRDFNDFLFSKFGSGSGSRGILDNPKSFLMEQLNSGFSDEEGSTTSIAIKR